MCHRKVLMSYSTLFLSYCLQNLVGVFTVTAHLRADEPHFKCSVVRWLGATPIWPMRGSACLSHLHPFA